MKATRRIIPVADRLHAKLVPQSNGCLQYSNAVTYGRIGWWDGDHWTMRLTHRVAWELNNGPIPPGLYVCHHCDNPPCCNPEHLFLGTNSENLLDLSRKGLFPQQQRTRCPSGHAYDEQNTYVGPTGKRFCRTCRNEGARRRYALNGRPDRTPRAQQ